MKCLYSCEVWELQSQLLKAKFCLLGLLLMSLLLDASNANCLNRSADLVSALRSPFLISESFLLVEMNASLKTSDLLCKKDQRIKETLKEMMISQRRVCKSQ